MQEILLKHCAEAKLYLGKFAGEKALIKERVVKGYRNDELNEMLIGNRTSSEANLIAKAKNAGVRTPVLYKVEKENGKIWMEFVDGKQLKEILLEKVKRNEKNLKGKRLNKEVKNYFKDVGKNIARLHSAGIIHGDLTTSNILIHNIKNEMVFLDFGLGRFSNKVEDMAVDLLNLKKTFLATHSEMEEGWADAEHAYIKEFGRGGEVIKHIIEVEKRVRYR